MPDLIFIDTETTGLEPSADIWEFAGIRRRADGSQECLHLFIEQGGAPIERHAAAIVFRFLPAGAEPDFQPPA